MSDVTAGQIVRLLNYSGTVSDPVGGYRDGTGTLVDPTTVTVKVKTPDGTTTAYTGVQLTKDGVGLYHLDLDTTALSGEWTFAWSSTGPQTYEYANFIVDPAPV